MAATISDRPASGIHEKTVPPFEPSRTGLDLVGELAVRLREAFAGLQGEAKGVALELINKAMGNEGISPEETEE